MRELHRHLKFRTAEMLILFIAAAMPLMASDVVITGVVDGPLTGGVPKAIELCVVNDVADLSAYGIGSANNGGGSDFEEFTFPAGSVSAGTFLYVASEAANFSTFFGFAPTHTSGAASINGDDAIELFMSGGVVDIFGDINVDGTGEAWEYLDGWAYRTDGTGPDGSTFVLANWSFSGPNALDGETTNATATTPFPIGAYSACELQAPPPDLLLTEIVVTPTEGEFVELHNPTAAAIDLSDVYLTDATFAGGGTFYYNIVTGANAGGGGYADFHARFPDGATIGPGEYQTVSLAGSDDFFAAFGFDPTYELFEDGAADGVPDMREALPGSVAGQGGLSNGGEVVILYTWDGAADLVQDIDYALWGDAAEAVDKTGVSIDGPDGDAIASTYEADTAIATQDVIYTGSHSSGDSFQRVDFAEGIETQSGGNGITGSDETSEDLSVTWSLEAATPGAGPPPPPTVGIVINEIMQNPSVVLDTNGEWFELVNPTTDPVDIDGWTIKDDGSNSHVIANSGPLVIPSGGYLVLGLNADSGSNGGVSIDYQYSNMSLGNSYDELILLDTGFSEVDRVEWDNGATFPDPTGATMALKHPALDNNVGDYWCESRSVFGAGDRGTPGAANGCLAGLVINEVDADQAGTDSAEFIEIYDGGAGGTDLSGLVVVLYNGSDDASYTPAIDLDGHTTDDYGYFVICGDAANVPGCHLDVSPNTNLIQNGADAVALIFGDAENYPNDTPLITEDLLDALVYDTNDSDDAGLLVLLNAGQPQVNEDGEGDKDNHSNQRCPNGFGGQRNTDAFIQEVPTPGGLNTCQALEIFDIQGAGPASPFDGFILTTAENVVTAVGVNGFSMQTPTARSDGNIDTSDGIYVFTGGPPSVSVGDLVNVTGLVEEFYGMTEITTSPVVTVVGTGTAPLPVVFDATVPSPDPLFPSCAIEYECYEGMLVQVAAGTVAASNQEFGSDPFAEIHVVARSGRAFREPGIEIPGLVGLPVWDGNPEVFELDADKLGLLIEYVPAGSTFSATGVIGFEFNHYELWPSEFIFVPAPLPVPVRPATPTELTVGSLNLFRLFDGDTLALSKLSPYIDGVLRSPDILAVQEVDNLGVLQDLATQIYTDTSSAVDYTPYLEEGNDIGGIDVGFLVRRGIDVMAVTQLGAGELFAFGTEVSPLHDRPPLLLEAMCDGTFPISVIVLHMRSLNGIETERTQQKRYEQAQSVAQMVQDIQIADPDVHLVVVGDFNAFEFTDGYVDLAGIVKGDFNPADSLVCDFNSCSDLVDPDLTDEVLLIPAAQRYSFIFRDSFNPAGSRGDAQVLDHAMTSAGLGDLVQGFEYGRGNADAAEELVERDGTDYDIRLRASDHDGLVLYLSKDEDHDGVPDAEDACLGTVIPEGVPTQRLGTNRWALVDDDGIFDTKAPNGKGPKRSFTIEDTAGCSCEQIIDELHLGEGHEKFGCSNGAMENWVEEVQD